MGQVRHGSATTTEAVRRALQHSQASQRALAKRYGVNQKTEAKWQGRTSVADVPTGPKEPRSTILTPDDEAVERCQADPEVTPSCRKRRFADPRLPTGRPDPKIQPVTVAVHPRRLQRFDLARGELRHRKFVPSFIPSSTISGWHRMEAHERPEPRNTLFL